MPNKHAAEKAMRISVRRRVRNRGVRSSTRTQVRQAVESTDSGDAANTEQAIRRAIRALDKAAAKGVIKKNNAARRKSRLMNKLNKMRAGAA